MSATDWQRVWGVLCFSPYCNWDQAPTPMNWIDRRKKADIFRYLTPATATLFTTIYGHSTFLEFVTHYNRKEMMKCSLLCFTIKVDWTLKSKNPRKNQTDWQKESWNGSLFLPLPFLRFCFPALLWEHRWAFICPTRRLLHLWMAQAEEGSLKFFAFQPKSTSVQDQT